MRSRHPRLPAPSGSLWRAAGEVDEGLEDGHAHRAAVPPAAALPPAAIADLVAVVLAVEKIPPDTCVGSKS